MTDVATQVLAKVNAPYGTDISVHQLAAKITDPKSALECNALVFAFFSEVPPEMQKEFIKMMAVDQEQASKVAAKFAEVSGYSLSLAA